MGFWYGLLLCWWDCLIEITRQVAHHLGSEDTPLDPTHTAKRELENKP